MIPGVSIYQLKRRFQDLLRPRCNRLAQRGVTANQVTGWAMLLSMLLGLLLWISGGARWVLILIPVWLFIRMALNAIDGMLAREHNQKSKVGAILNELGDVISDASLYLPFCAVAGLSAATIVLIVVLAVISEMTGVLGVTIGASRRYDGPMGKSDRAFVFGLLAFLLAIGVKPGVWSMVLLWVVLLLLLITIVNRAHRGLREVA